MQWSIRGNMQLLLTGQVPSTALTCAHIKYERKLFKLLKTVCIHTHSHADTHTQLVHLVRGRRKNMKKWTLELLRKRARQCLNFPQDVRYVKSNI